MATDASCQSQGGLNFRNEHYIFTHQSSQIMLEVQYQDQFGKWHDYQGGFSAMSSALVSARQALRLKKSKARIINTSTGTVEDLLTP
jgi:hypothetical protein